MAAYRRRAVAALLASLALVLALSGLGALAQAAGGDDLLPPGGTDPAPEEFLVPEDTCPLGEEDLLYGPPLIMSITVPYGTPFASSVQSTPLQTWTNSPGGTYTWSATGPGTATFTPQGSTQTTSTMVVSEPGSYTVKVQYDKNGQKANAEKGPVVALEADLQMDGVGPAEEDAAGGFLQVGGPRRRVTLHYAPDGPLESHKLTFFVSSHLAVYAAETGGAPLTANDLEWDDRDPPEGQDNWAEKPSELWLAATAASGGPQGDSASLNYEGRTTVNTGGHTDGITIKCVQLKSIGFVDAGQGNGGDNEHPINRNSGDHGGWGLGTEVIPDPVWVADGPDLDTDPDVNEAVCYTRSVDEEGEENDVPSRLKVTVVVVAPDEAPFSLVGKDGGLEVFRADGLTGTGTEQSVSLAAAESYTLPPNVAALATTFTWHMVFTAPEPDVDVVVASSTHTIYVVLDAPLEAVTPKRLDKVVGWCDGLAAVTPCADAIWGGLGGTPPRFGLGGGNPTDPWWMMDPNGPSGECIDLAKLMRDMCRLLGLGVGEIGYVYGSTDADCYSTSPSAFQARNCPGGVHGAEEIAFYAGGWNNWEAVFRINDWYYAPKVAKSQTPLEILRTILGANAPGPYHTGTHQAWVAAGGGTACCQNPGPHPVPLPPN